jgi:hypothetical protein
MWYVMLIVLCAGVAVYLILRKAKKTESARDVYVCTVCGEKHCICHKEEHGRPAGGAT